MALILAALSGCAVNNDEGVHTAIDDHLTLERAKEHAIAVRDAVAELYPAEDIAESRANATSKALYPCNGEDRFAWPGRTTITVVGKADKNTALDAIADKWQALDGWTVKQDTSSKGFPRVVLDHVDGTHVNVAYFYDGAELWVDATSPCFTLPGGLTMGGEY